VRDRCLHASSSCPCLLEDEGEEGKKGEIREDMKESRTSSKFAEEEKCRATFEALLVPMCWTCPLFKGEKKEERGEKREINKEEGLRLLPGQTTRLDHIPMIPICLSWKWFSLLIYDRIQKGMSAKKKRKRRGGGKGKGENNRGN